MAGGPFVTGPVGRYAIIFDAQFNLVEYEIVVEYSGLYGGYLTFVVSIGAIGFCTAIIGDVAGHLGCFIFLKDGVNAIAFVALGTSVPGKTRNISTIMHHHECNSSFLGMNNFFLSW